MTRHVHQKKPIPTSVSSAGTRGAKTDFHTDLGNARRFVRRHGKNIRFIPEWNKWIVWNGSRWEVDDDGAAMRLAKETVIAMYSEALGLANEQRRTALLKRALKGQAEARLKAMVSLAESEAAVVLPANKLDADPWVLGVQNGVVELKTGKFRPARAEDLITKRANVVFDPNAQCPNWLKFLDTVTGGDVSLQSYIQRVVGYALTGSVREEVMFVLCETYQRSLAHVISAPAGFRFSLSSSPSRPATLLNTVPFENCLPTFRADTHMSAARKRAPTPAEPSKRSSLLGLGNMCQAFSDKRQCHLMNNGFRAPQYVLLVDRGPQFRKSSDHHLR